MPQKVGFSEVCEHTTWNYLYVRVMLRGQGGSLGVRLWVGRQLGLSRVLRFRLGLELVMVVVMVRVSVRVRVRVRVRFRVDKDKG